MSKFLIDGEDLSDVGLSSSSEVRSNESDSSGFEFLKERQFEFNEQKDVVFSEKISFIDFSSKKEYDDLSLNQKKQLISQSDGWYYGCSKARQRQIPLLYPLACSAALRFIKPERFDQKNANFLDIHSQVLSEVFSKPKILSLEPEDLIEVQWNEKCFAALSKITNTAIIILHDLGKDEPSTYSFFYPDEKEVSSFDASPPILFVQSDRDFGFLYSRSRNDVVNFNLSLTDVSLLNAFENIPDTFLYQRLAPLVSEYTFSFEGKRDVVEVINFVPYIVLPRPVDNENPKYFSSEYQEVEQKLKTPFIYDVEGGIFNNAPQAISAALLLNENVKYSSRTEHNFLGVRMAIDKYRGITTSISSRNQFRLFDLSDFVAASIVYNADILIRYNGVTDSFYAKIPAPGIPSLTILLEYRSEVFFLLLPSRLSDDAITAYNTPYTSSERKSKGFLETLGSKRFEAFSRIVYYITPDFSERVIRGSSSLSERKKRLDALARRIKRKKKGLNYSSENSESSENDIPQRSSSSFVSFPSSSSSSSSLLQDDEDYSFQTKKEDDGQDVYEKEELELNEFALNEGILIMPSVMRNSNMRRYKHADTDDTISLIDNYKLTLFPNGRTLRQFNNNMLFVWRTEFSTQEGRRWPSIFTSKPLEMVFIHRSVPVDSYTSEFTTTPPTSLQDGFFVNFLIRFFSRSEPNEKTYLSTPQDFVIYARINKILPFGVFQDNRSPPLEDGLVDIDGFMKFFDLVGSFAETHRMNAHRYNLYHIYASMLRDIDVGSFSPHRMTERVLWFLYTFLLKNHPHFLRDNPIISDEMTAIHGHLRDLFAVKLFNILFKSSCFKWQWKLSHLWLFAYLCLNPSQSTLPLTHLRSAFQEYIRSGVFKNNLYHNTSTALMDRFQESIANQLVSQESISISNDILNQLITWERPIDAEVTKLPLYTVHYPLLFGIKTPEDNKPLFSVVDLYYHNQIHDVIIHTTTPSGIRNVDNLLFSLQTVDGLPITSYKIDGFPAVLNPAKPPMHEFLTGLKLAPVVIKKTALFSPGVLKFKDLDQNLPENTARTSLLFARIEKTVEYIADAATDISITREPKISKYLELNNKNDGWFELTDDGDYIWVVEDSLDKRKEAFSDWRVQNEIWKNLIVYYPSETFKPHVLQKSNTFSRVYMKIQMNIKKKKDSRQFNELRTKIYDKVMNLLKLAKDSPDQTFSKQERRVRRLSTLGKAISDIKKSFDSWDMMESKVTGYNRSFFQRYGVDEFGMARFVDREQEMHQERLSNVESAFGLLIPTTENTKGYVAIQEMVEKFKALTVPLIPLPPPSPAVPPSQILKSEEFIQPPFQRLLRNCVGLSLVGVEMIKRHHTNLTTQESLQSFTRRIRTCVASLDRTLVQLFGAMPVVNSWAFPVVKHNFENPSNNIVSYVRRRRDEIIFSDKEIEHIIESRYIPHVLLPEIYKNSEEIALIHEKVTRAKMISETPFRKNTSQVVVNELVPFENKLLRSPSTRLESARFLFDPDFRKFYTQSWAFLSGISVYSAVATQPNMNANPETLGMNRQFYEFLKGVILEGKNTSLQDLYKKFTISCDCLRVRTDSSVPFLRMPYRSTVADIHATRRPDVRFSSANTRLVPNANVTYFIEYQIDRCFAMFPNASSASEAGTNGHFFLHAPLFLEFMGIREVSNTGNGNSSDNTPIDIDTISHLITFKVRIADEFILSVTPGFSNYFVRGYEYGRSLAEKNKQPVSVLSVSNTAVTIPVIYSKNTTVPSNLITSTRLFTYNSRLLNYVFWDGLLSYRRYVPQVMSYFSESRYATMYQDVKESLFEGFDIIKPSPSPWRPNDPSQSYIEHSSNDITASKYNASNVCSFTFAFMAMENMLGWPYPMAHYDTLKGTAFTLLSHVPIIYKSKKLYDDRDSIAFLLTDFLPFKSIETDYQDSLPSSPSSPPSNSSPSTPSDTLPSILDLIGAGLEDDVFAGDNFGNDEEADFVSREEGGFFLFNPREAYNAAKKITKQYKNPEDAARARRKYLSKILENSVTFLEDLFWYLFDIPIFDEKKQQQQPTTGTEGSTSAQPLENPASVKKQQKQSTFETEQRLRIRRIENYRLDFPEAFWAAEDAFSHNRLLRKEAVTKELRSARQKKTATASSNSKTKETEYDVLVRDTTFVNTSFFYQSRQFARIYESERTAGRIFIPRTPETVENEIWQERYRFLSQSQPNVDINFAFSGIYPRTSPIGYTPEQADELIATVNLDEETREFLTRSVTQNVYDFNNEFLFLQDYNSDVATLQKKINSEKPYSDVRYKKIKAILTAILAKEFNDYGFLYPDLKLVCIMMSENLYTIITRLLCRVTNEVLLREVQSNLWHEWIIAGYTVVFLPLFQVYESARAVDLSNQEISSDDETEASTSLVDDPQEPLPSSSSGETSVNTITDLSDDVEISPTSSSSSHSEPIEEDMFYDTYFTTTFLSRETSKKFLDAAINQLLRDVILFKEQAMEHMARFGSETVSKQSFIANHVVIPRFLWHEDSDPRIVANILERLQFVFGPSPFSQPPVNSAALTPQIVNSYAESVIKQRFNNIAMPLKDLKKPEVDFNPTFHLISDSAKIDGGIGVSTLLAYIPEIEDEKYLDANRQRRRKVENFDEAFKDYTEVSAEILKEYRDMIISLKTVDRYSDDISINPRLLSALLTSVNASEALHAYKEMFLTRCALKSYTTTHLLVEQNPQKTPASNHQDSVARYIDLMGMINDLPIEEAKQNIDAIFTTRSFNALLENNIEVPSDVISSFNDPLTTSVQKRIILRKLLFHFKLEELRKKYTVPSQEEETQYDAMLTFKSVYHETEHRHVNKEIFATIFAAYLEMIEAYGLNASQNRPRGANFATQIKFMHRKYAELKKNNNRYLKGVKYYRESLKKLYETEPTDENIFELLAETEQFFQQMQLISAYDVPTKNDVRSNPFDENPARKTLMRQALLQFVFERAFPSRHSKDHFLNTGVNTYLTSLIASKDKKTHLDFVFSVLNPIITNTLQIDFRDKQTEGALVSIPFRSLDTDTFVFNTDMTWSLNPVLFEKVFTPKQIQDAAERLRLYYKKLNDREGFADFANQSNEAILRHAWSTHLVPSSTRLFRQSTFVDNFNLGPEYIITAINNQIIEKILNNNENVSAFIHGAFDIYNLAWDLKKTLQVLTTNNVLSSIENVSRDANKVTSEESSFSDNVEVMKNFLTNPANLHPVTFSHFINFFNTTCLSRSRVFFTPSNVTPLLQYMMKRAPAETMNALLTRLNITFDPSRESQGALLKKIKAVAFENSKKRFPWFKKSSEELINHLEVHHECHFTPFEKNIISLVWKRSQSFTLEKLYDIVVSFRKHDWLSLLNVHDLIDLFVKQPSVPGGIKFAVTFKSLEDLKLRQELSERSKLLFGVPLSVIETNFIRCCSLFGIHPEIIRQCFIINRPQALYELMKTRILVSFRFDNTPAERRKDPRVVMSIIESAINDSTSDAPDFFSLPETMNTLDVTIDQTGDLVQTTNQEVVTEDLPESHFQNIVMTDAILEAYLQANKKFHDVLAKTRENAFKVANHSGVITRRAKKKIMEDSEVPTFLDLYKSSKRIMDDRKRFDVVGYQAVTIAFDFNDGTTLFKTISYYLSPDHTINDSSIHKDEVLLWIAANLDTPLSDNTDRVFRDVINVPLYSGYPLDESSQDSAERHKIMEREYYLEYIRSDKMWNDLVFLLAAAHVYNRPVHLITSLAEDSIWHSTFYPSSATLTMDPIPVLCLDMIYFLPLISQNNTSLSGTSTRPLPSSSSLSDDPSDSSDSSSLLEDDPSFIGTSHAKWCYMAHEHTVRGHTITPAQRRLFWYHCSQ